MVEKSWTSHPRQSFPLPPPSPRWKKIIFPLIGLSRMMAGDPRENRENRGSIPRRGWMEAVREIGNCFISRFDARYPTLSILPPFSFLAIPLQRHVDSKFDIFRSTIGKFSLTGGVPQEMICEERRKDFERSRRDCAIDEIRNYFRS